ncbi:MAG: hypothetical protein M1569_02960 [Candidatus Marsarchaeota archaeon]|nr:hypothetical protein [Candidatus Marsarchaeota archaeon]MCL5413337.1 hypothetical protein [Candidatus Marsarchaeota archaeon]
MIEKAIPMEARAFFLLAKRGRAQGSLEYIMMLSAASIVILIALAMIVKMKSAVAGTVSINGTNMSISQAISKQLSELSTKA